MRRERASRAVAGVAAAAALAAPLLLVARPARSETLVEAVGSPSRAAAIAISGGATQSSLVFHPGALPAIPDARYAVRIAVGSSQPTQQFALTLRDRDGRQLARCSFAPGEYVVERYGQTTLLACAIAHPERLRTVVVAARDEDNGVFLRSGAGAAPGRLLAPTREGLAAAIGRLGVTRPAAFRAPTLLAALCLSFAALAAAVLVIAQPRRSTG